MKKCTQLFLLLLCFSFYGQAQYNSSRNKVWAFGRFAGLNFSSGSPVSFRTQMNTSEGSASVADKRDSLLFYTDGNKVWDRANTMMLGGGSIASFLTSSTTQAAAIVPFVDDSNQYYIFSLEFAGATSGYCHLAYSVINMSLRSGLGNVTSVRNIHLVDNMSEKMTVVAGNNCDLWLITHLRDSAIFCCYHITSSGLDPVPILSRVGQLPDNVNRYDIGVIKVSPDRTKLVNQCWSNFALCELFDFDATSGIISNSRVLDSVNHYYGAEFSPNSQFLYSEIYGGAINQYDISRSSVDDIKASMYQVTRTSTSDLKLAPDGKIYKAGYGNSRYLSTIDSPDLTGARCSYRDSSVLLDTLTSCGLGFPNIVYTVKSNDTSVGVYHYSYNLALGDSITLNAPTSCVSYLWNDGTIGSTIRVGVSGTYWCRFTTDCSVVIDTFHIDLRLGVVDLNDQSTITIPNAFTPDGTVNRTFKVLYNGDAKLNYFRIFDRWGNKVFESTDINAGWDGHYNGKLMPQDAYIYQIQAVTSNGKIITKAGNVTLLR